MGQAESSASSEEESNTEEQEKSPSPSPSPVQDQTKRRILIIGDSITHGSEGDYTWRYRLWQWFQEHALDAEFVGPYTGVNAPAHPHAPQPPRFPDEPEAPPADRIPWGYARDVAPDFDSRHFATCGYQAAQARKVVAAVVRDARPTCMLLMLGFNDLAWFVSDADGLFRSIRTIIRRARRVRPRLRFAVANVVHRTWMKDREDLVESTDRYNALLRDAVREWSTERSPVALVDVAAVYGCGPQYKDQCPAAFDGLHPNALGEYQIARAFSTTLHQQYGLGSAPITIPSEIPPRDLHAPHHVVAQGSPMGIKATWDHVYGAEYQLQYRIKGQTDWLEGHCSSNRFDYEFTDAGTEWELCVRACHGYERGPWSATSSAVARKDGAPPPHNIQTSPTSAGFHVSWEPPATSRVIDRFEVAWKDEDENWLGFANQASRSDSATIENLKAGHVVSVLMRSWSLIDGEWAAGGYEVARPIRVDRGPPSRPTDLQVTNVSPNTARLSWTGSDGDAGYLVYVRDVGTSNTSAETDGQVVRERTHEVGCVFETWRYEFSVSAINGDEESARSSAVIPPRDVDGHL